MIANERENNNLSNVVVESFENEAIEAPFVEKIEVAYQELRAIIPTLPEKLKVVFGTNYEYGDDGVTGSAIAADAIKVGIKPDMENRSVQFEKIRSLIFHEGYHVAQGFYLDGPGFSALESAVYEGCATIFEREYTDSTPKWADYSSENETALRRWYDEMKDITAEQYFEPTGETWKKWAFYDPETGESWRIYKVGTWLVERVIAKTNVDIADLSTSTANEILGMLE